MTTDQTNTAPLWWHCPTHGKGNHKAWGCPECVREMRAELADLHADKKSFQMAYRMRCDEETKDQAVQIERLTVENERLGLTYDDVPLEQALKRAYYYDERGNWREVADEWERWHAVAKVATRALAAVGVKQ